MTEKYYGDNILILMPVILVTISLGFIGCSDLSRNRAKNIIMQYLNQINKDLT